jgi:hypothetical protein
MRLAANGCDRLTQAAVGLVRVLSAYPITSSRGRAALAHLDAVFQA